MELTGTPITAELVRGAVELERTEHGLLPHRLPAWARAQSDDGQLLMAESQPSGVRLVFRTRATSVDLDTRRSISTYTGMLPDALHPDAETHRLVGRRFADAAFGPDGPFAEG